MKVEQDKTADFERQFAKLERQVLAAQGQLDQLPREFAAFQAEVRADIRRLQEETRGAIRDVRRESFPMYLVLLALIATIGFWW